MAHDAAASANGNGHYRSRLVIPLAVCIILAWLASMLDAIVRRDVQVLLIATGPFTMLCGYVFGVALLRGINVRSG